MYTIHMNAYTYHRFVHTHTYIFLKPLLSAKSSSRPRELARNKEMSTLLLGSLYSSQKDSEHANKVIPGTDSAININSKQVPAVKVKVVFEQWLPGADHLWGDGI